MAMTIIFDENLYVAHGFPQLLYVIVYQRVMVITNYRILTLTRVIILIRTAYKPQKWELQTQVVHLEKQLRL